MKFRFGHMMQDYYLAKVRESSAKRKLVFAGIKNKFQAKQYVGSVRRKIAMSFGSFPERTPLNASVVGVLGGKGFTVEKIIFYSRPNFPVSGNLYLPSGIKGKIPAVLGLCGHTQIGKAEPAYQSFCQGLVLKGYAVFIIDPISQGERYQFINAKNAEDISGRCCNEHNMLGKHLSLLGEFFGSWRVWDAIRGLDYILSRPEVDASRVGVTGNSGGGTLTSYINALDGRLTMAAPGCFITTYLRNLENELPCDCEQIPPNILKYGLEMSDLIIARAPRPFIILGQRNDFFDPRGTMEAYEEVRHIYSLLGAEDNIRLEIGADNHGYSLSNREAMYKFFNEFAKVKRDNTEAKIKVYESGELQSAPGGQVINLKGNKLLHSFILEKAEALRKSRKIIRTKDELKDRALKILAIKLPESVPSYRILRPLSYMSTQRVIFNRFAIETEPGILAILNQRCEKDLHHIPVEKNAILYVPHMSVYEELKDGLKLDSDANSLLFGLDIRGIGETTPCTCNVQDENFFAPYNHDFFYASQAIMLGKAYIGGKVFDVLSAVKLLKSRGVKQIHLVARGQGGIVAAFAALLSDDINRVSLFNVPLAYEEILQSEVSKWPFSYMISAILETLDLPDVYNALSSKKLKIVEPWDALFKVLRKSKVNSLMKKYSIKKTIVGVSRAEL